MAVIIIIILLATCTEGWTFTLL